MLPNPFTNALMYGGAVVGLALVGLAALPAFAAVGAVAEPSLLDIGGVLLSALSGGQYALLGAAALLLLVLAARKVGGRYVPFLATPRGGAVLALLVAGLTSLVARLSAGAPLSLGLVLEAVTVALSASGLWSVGKNLAAPKPVAQMAPTICTPIEIANGTCKP